MSTHAGELALSAFIVGTLAMVLWGWSLAHGPTRAGKRRGYWAGLFCAVVYGLLMAATVGALILDGGR